MSMSLLHCFVQLARIRVSTNRTEGQIGQLKVAGRRLKGGKLPATGNRSIAVLACAYHLRFPGIEGLGKAFLAFYDKFIDKSAPGSELGEARKYFDSLTAERSIKQFAALEMPPAQSLSGR